MKKCNKCGNFVSNHEKICNNCKGTSFYVMPYEETKERPEGGSTVLQQIAKALMVISCFLGGALIIPLLWLLPMTISYFRKVKSGKRISTGFKICVFLFVNVIAGITMLCDSSDKMDESATKATQNADLRKTVKVLMVLSTILSGLTILPLAWYIPMTVVYFKKVKKGQRVGLGFKICALLFVNLYAGIYMLCDDESDLKEEVAEDFATSGAVAVNSELSDENVSVAGDSVTAESVVAVSDVSSELDASETAGSAETTFAGATILQKICKVLMVISCVVGGLLILPLAWLIPMTVAYFKKVNSGKKVGVGFKVCVLLFVNVITGITMLCDSNDEVDESAKKAKENADLRKAVKILMVLSTVLSGLTILPLAWYIPMTAVYFKKVKKGQRVGLGFKICTLIFVNVYAGAYMLCDDAADLKVEEVAENPAENAEEESTEAAVAAVFTAEEESEEVKEQKRLENERKKIAKSAMLKKASGVILALAAVFAFVLTAFIGQTVRYIGQVRNADSTTFSYFTDKNLIDYLAVLDESAIRQMITDNGVYVTEELVNAYRTISITETVVAIFMLVAVCVFFVIAVSDFIKNLKDNFQKPRLFGAIATVVSYLCGAFIFKAINFGELSVVYKIRNQVQSTFRLSLGFNTATIIGVAATLVLVIAALVMLVMTDVRSSEKIAVKGNKKADKLRNFAPAAEKIFAGAVAVCALVSVVFASISTVTMNSKGSVAVYYKNETTGEYELTDYSSEKGDSLTLFSLIQKYSLEEEEILYNIEICQIRIRENDADIDTKIQLENYRASLADRQKLIADALNFGLTTMYVDIALIVFAGVLICFVLCGRRIQKGDLLVVVAVLEAIFALLGCMIIIFVMTSFAQLEVQVTGVAPFFHLLFSIAALIGCFYTRKCLQYNVDMEKGDQKDVVV